MPVFVADEQDAVAIDTQRLAALARHVLVDRKVPDDMEVNLLFVDSEAITGLNRTHMGFDRPTDVLAFPLDMPGESLADEVAILGDVVICPQVAAEQATDRGHDPTSELELLVVHGLLHLLGHDHGEDDDRSTMFALTERLLEEWRA